MTMSDNTGAVAFDPALITRYDRAGPRYTSYPTAAEFHDGFGAGDLRRHVAASNAAAPAGDLSLYVHIPFCDTVCFYCACNKVITRNRAHAVHYLERLSRELGMLGAMFPAGRRVRQLHWGGGTPTYLSNAQVRALMVTIGASFDLDPGGEFSIEIDPRRLEDGAIENLREAGFNRLSMGVQDLDPVVQKAVNRIQPADLTFGVLERARAAGFRSVSLDLIYGLPHQTRASFLRTLEAVVDALPDRLSVFNYAHLPARFKTQRQIDAATLPDPAEKLAILEASGEFLQARGYVYIGMDHFARESDDIARALREGTLQRNFQGYSTHADCELVAAGASAIAQLGTCYAQNAHRLEEYEQRIDGGELATVRGVELDAEDLLRRDVISALMCRFELDFARVGERHEVDFERHFAAELADLEPMARDGLVEIGRRGMTVTPAGRLLIRNLCMVFDAYRRAAAPGAAGFSKVI